MAFTRNPYQKSRGHVDPWSTETDDNELLTGTAGATPSLSGRVPETGPGPLEQLGEAMDPAGGMGMVNPIGMASQIPKTPGLLARLLGRGGKKSPGGNPQAKLTDLLASLSANEMAQTPAAGGVALGRLPKANPPPAPTRFRNFPRQEPSRGIQPANLPMAPEAKLPSFQDQLAALGDEFIGGGLPPAPRTPPTSPSGMGPANPPPMAPIRQPFEAISPHAGPQTPMSASDELWLQQLHKLDAAEKKAFRSGNTYHGSLPPSADANLARAPEVDVNTSANRLASMTEPEYDAFKGQMMDRNPLSPELFTDIGGVPSHMYQAPPLPPPLPRPQLPMLPEESMNMRPWENLPELPPPLPVAAKPMPGVEDVLTPGGGHAQIPPGAKRNKWTRKKLSRPRGHPERGVGKRKRKPPPKSDD